ncbi:MAG: hypothetical protein ACXVRW_16015 [Solirubrobacteraceae bacterium]
MRKIITLIITGLALVVAAPAMGAGVMTPVKSAVSIQKPIRQQAGSELNFVFVGKVTAANGVAQKNREVILFDWQRFSGGPQSRILGSITTGAYAGHSQGYWQLTVQWWAGIANHHFYAYALDRFVPPPTNVGPWFDYLPAMSRLMPFTG